MEKICDHLKAKGLKQTRHRLTILSLLKNAEYPLSADEIYLQLKNESINLSTVYRNLELPLNIVPFPVMKKGWLMKQATPL
ncbi:MAG: Fur family transcriptional regulator, ferric uptake regulator [Eubacteriaceae bacterium]|nr:Fur family transcriptional regulator, ferric uptake regulator [Eubacteriaceae bacterium]